jgi:aryl-alcohol dehydrogenase-like predicted oxidoreductase
MGVLTGKYKPGEKPARDTRAGMGGAIEDDYLSERTLTAVQKLRLIADELGLTMAALAIAWVLHNDNVSSAIIGATRPEQVEENVEASGAKLGDDLMKRIDEVLGEVVTDDPSLTG